MDKHKVIKTRNAQRLPKKKASRLTWTTVHSLRRIEKTIGAQTAEEMGTLSVLAYY